YKAKEIKINRKARKLTNSNLSFEHQNRGKHIYISMKQLMKLVDFLQFLNPNTNPFYVDGEAEVHHDTNENEIIIDELDRLNIKRLIDKSLDERDEAAFYTLLKLL